MARKRGKKKRKIRRRAFWKAVLRLLTIFIVLGVLCYLTIVLFETKKIYVTGTKYSSSQEVLGWIKSDKHSSNTLYILWKYNKDGLEQPPAVEDIEVKMSSPWEVTVHVKEKTYSGKVEWDGKFLYFDKEGIASLISAEAIEGVPFIEGMEINREKMKLGKPIPVKNPDIFETIDSATELLNKRMLTPDKISCMGDGLVLSFGGVRVQLGSTNYSDKLAQVIPILAKLQELYPGQAGILHLENYSTSDSSIRFVPDPAPQPAPEG